MTERAPRRLFGRTAVISGASRGIGLAIAKGVAREGANVVFLSKTDVPHARLPGTVHSAVDEINGVGGRAVGVVGDVRDETDVARAVTTAVDTFGGIDFCINNASAIALEPSEHMPSKKFDLMIQVNIRGTFLLTKACLPHLRRSPNAHVITIAPPINMNPVWLGPHPGYTMSKYGMTLLSLGWAEEFAEFKIAVNCLWPQTSIATAAVANLPDGASLMARSRHPDVMADAVLQIVGRPATEATGECYIDADLLTDRGHDLTRYGGSIDPNPAMFLD